MTRSRRALFGLGEVLRVRCRHLGAGCRHLGWGDGAMLGLPLGHEGEAKTSAQLALKRAADETRNWHARLGGRVIHEVDKVGRQCYRYLLGGHAFTIPRYGLESWTSVAIALPGTGRYWRCGSRWLSLSGI